MLYVRWAQDPVAAKSLDPSSPLSPVTSHGASDDDESSPISPPPNGPGRTHHIIAVIIAVVFTLISGASIVQTISSLI
jgi:hypothetical protein